MPEAFKCAHTKIIPITELKPNPRNPNIHSEQQVSLLARIMEFQGQRAPIIVSNQTGLIVKGHGRLEALQKAGWQNAAVDFQDYQSEEHEYADMVADNEIAKLATTDKDRILESLKDLEFGDDFDFEMLGIPDFNLDDLLGTEEDEVVGAIAEDGDLGEGSWKDNLRASGEMIGTSGKIVLMYERDHYLQIVDKMSALFKKYEVQNASELVEKLLDNA